MVWPGLALKPAIFSKKDNDLEMMLGAFFFALDPKFC